MTFICFYVCSGSFADDRKALYELSHAAAYGMIGHIISRIYNISSEEICLAKEKSGRPVLLYPDTGVNISVSHSDTIAVSAISRSSIGIDIETIAPLKNDIQDYSDFFSSEGLACIAGSDSIADSFAVMWTRKEAYLKRRGNGIKYLKMAPCFDASTRTIMLNSAEGAKFPFSYSMEDDTVWLFRYSCDTIGKLLEIYDSITRSTVL